MARRNAARQADDVLFEVENLEVDFKTANRDTRIGAVRGVDLSVARGEFVGVVGESGSGKSVTMMAALGLLPGTAEVRGSVRFQGNELLGLSARDLRRYRGARIGYVFQDAMTALNPVVTIGKQLREAVRVHNRRLSRTAVRRRAVELLELVSIPSAEERLSSYPYQLSGGMRQRVMIAIAVANEPDLLIADEPTTALDVTIQAQIMDALVSVREKTDASVLLISHDMAIMAGVADRVVVMYAGSVVEEGDVRRIFYQAQHPYTEALLKCLPRLDRANPTLESIPGSFPSTTDVPAGCIFHDRCAHRQERCRVEVPELLVHAPDARAACHFPLSEVTRG